MIRNDLDKIDKQLTALLEDRMDLCKKVAEYKNVNTFSLNSGMYIVVVDGVSNKVIIK